MTLKKIAVRELQVKDFFAFSSSKTFYYLLTIEAIGLDLYHLSYSYTRKSGGFKTIKKGSELVKVEPVGRHYGTL
jgi:hypothetical protein